MARSDATAVQLTEDEASAWSSNLLSELEESRGASFEAIRTMREWRSLFIDRPDLETPMFEGASVIVSPFVKQSALALMAEVVPAVLDPDPIAHYEGFTGSGKVCADLLENFVQTMLRDYTDFRDTFRQLAYAGFRDGTALLMTTWETRYGALHTWGHDLEEEMDPQTGLPMQRMSLPTLNRSVVPVYDWPKYTVVQGDRIAVLPAHMADIDTSPGVGIQFNVNAGTLLSRAHEGVYDETVVKRVLDHSFSTSEDASPDDDIFGVSTTMPYSSDPTKDSEPSLTRKVQITEVWRERQRWDKDTKRHYFEDWLFTIEEQTGEILQARPWRMWGPVIKRRPFALFRPYVAVQGIFGDSLATAGGAHVQQLKTEGLRMAFNMALRSISKRIIVPRSAYREVEKVMGKRADAYFQSPQAVIPFPDTLWESGNKPIVQFDDGAPPTSMLPILEFADREGQKSGMTDTQKGVPNAGDMTATEAAQIAEGSKKIIGMMVENAASCVEEVIKATHGLLVENVGRESVQQLWDQMYGDRMDHDAYPIEICLDQPYTISSNGVAATTNRAIKEQRAKAFASLVLVDPMVVNNPMRRHALLSYVAREAGIQHPEDLMGTAAEWGAEAQAQAQQQLMAAGLVSPGPAPSDGAVAPSGVEGSGQTGASSEEAGPSATSVGPMMVPGGPGTPQEMYERPGGEIG